MRKLFFLMVVIQLIVACASPQPKPKADATQKGQLTSTKVAEVIQGTSYTYLRVTDALSEKWVAVSRQEFTVGEELYLNLETAAVMENFHSKELNRDFPTILFVSTVSREPEMTSAQMPAMGGKTPAGKKAAPVEANVKVEPAAGGITIAELYTNKANYSGKKVKLKGAVVKVNDQIMGRNWIHLQDGTKNGEDFDLTLTTQATVLVGDVITIEGVVSLAKDFGAGYFYPLIIEDATIVK